METNQARELESYFWNGVDCKIHGRGCCFECQKAQAFAQDYGSSEYERGLREGLERAAKIADKFCGEGNNPGASIRQIK